MIELMWNVKNWKHNELIEDMDKDNISDKYYDNKY